MKESKGTFTEEQRKPDPTRNKRKNVPAQHGFKTTDGLNVYLPELSQNTGAACHGDIGSSACTGIGLCIAEDIFTNDIDLKTDNFERLKDVYISSLFKANKYWGENELGCMDPARSYKLPLFHNFREKCAIASDIAWHKAVNIDGFSDVEDALKVALYSAITSVERQSAILLITLSNKTFCILVDSKRNIALFDSHVHFTAVEEEVSFEMAIKRKDLQGMIVLAPSGRYVHLAKYVFSVIMRELRANDFQGTILSIACEARSK